MSRKPRLLLLDAGAIFEALRIEGWEALVRGYEVLVPSTIVHVEAGEATLVSSRRSHICFPILTTRSGSSPGTAPRSRRQRCSIRIAG
ncbi:MAG TPA: hypothetical protein VMT52_03740 [Planctomycetota bacterium]|nr:hypothetical protein [Planctomycetota bacterium]